MYFPRLLGSCLPESGQQMWLCVRLFWLQRWAWLWWVKQRHVARVGTESSSSPVFYTRQATEGKSSCVTLRTQEGADGATSRSMRQNTAGSGGREGTRCRTAGRPPTTRSGQRQVELQGCMHWNVTSLCVWVKQLNNVVLQVLKSNKKRMWARK